MKLTKKLATQVGINLDITDATLNIYVGSYACGHSTFRVRQNLLCRYCDALVSTEVLDTVEAQLGKADGRDEDLLHYYTNDDLDSDQKIVVQYLSPSIDNPRAALYEVHELTENGVYEERTMTEARAILARVKQAQDVVEDVVEVESDESTQTITTREAAALANVSVATVSKWSRDRTINATKIAGRWSIDRASLLAHINATQSVETVEVAPTETVEVVEVENAVIHQVTVTSSNRVDTTTVYVGNPTSDHYATMEAQALKPIAPLAALPGSVVLPRSCQKLLDAAHAAGITWTLGQHATDGNTPRVSITLYGLDSAPIKFSWHGNRLFTYGMSMPLKDAHALIGERVDASVAAGTVEVPVKAFRVKGTTTDVTTCDQCGREDLRGTTVLEILDTDGNGTGDMVYYGSDCAAKATGWTQAQVRRDARAADQAVKDAEYAARMAAQRAESDRKHALYLDWLLDTFGSTDDTQGGYIRTRWVVRGVLKTQYQKIQSGIPVEFPRRDGVLVS